MVSLAPTSYQVKNTFVEVEDFDDLFGELGILKQAKRQSTDPSPSTKLPFSQEDCDSREMQFQGELEHEPCKEQASIDDDELANGEAWTRIDTPPAKTDAIDMHGNPICFEEAGATKMMPMVPVAMWPEMVHEPTVARDVVTASNASLNGEHIPREWAATSTIMMRNVPHEYTRSLLLELINAAGFQSCYDFMYLPIDGESHVNRGYAFINFVEPQFAWLFKVRFEGLRMHFETGECVTVMPAKLQGLQANYNQLCNSSVMHGPVHARPLFLTYVHQPQLTQPKHGPSSRVAPRRPVGRVSLIDQAAFTQQSSAPMPRPHVAIGQQARAQPMVPAGRPNQKRFCPFCGGKAAPDFKFCPVCGASMT